MSSIMGGGLLCEAYSEDMGEQRCEPEFAGCASLLSQVRPGTMVKYQGKVLNYEGMPHPVANREESGTGRDFYNSPLRLQGQPGAERYSDTS